MGDAEGIRAAIRGLSAATPPDKDAKQKSLIPKGSQMHGSTIRCLALAPSGQLGGWLSPLRLGIAPTRTRGGQNDHLP